jgi:hypothetical protein
MMRGRAFSPAQLLDIDGAGSQHRNRILILRQGQQKVLERRVFVPPLIGGRRRVWQGYLEGSGGSWAGIGSHRFPHPWKFFDIVGSLERSVMPRARTFNELQLEGTSERIAELPLIDRNVREGQRVRHNRD